MAGGGNFSRDVQGLEARSGARGRRGRGRGAPRTGRHGHAGEIGSPARFSRRRSLPDTASSTKKLPCLLATTSSAMLGSKRGVEIDYERIPGLGHCDGEGATSFLGVGLRVGLPAGFRAGLSLGFRVAFRGGRGAGGGCMQRSRGAGRRAWSMTRQVTGGSPAQSTSSRGGTRPCSPTHAARARAVSGSTRAQDRQLAPARLQLVRASRTSDPGQHVCGVSSNDGGASWQIRFRTVSAVFLDRVVQRRFASEPRRSMR